MFNSVRVGHQGGESRQASNPILGFGAGGVLYVAVKASEWASKVAQGLIFPHNDFVSFYCMLTGVHMVVNNRLTVVRAISRDSPWCRGRSRPGHGAAIVFAGVAITVVVPQWHSSSCA